MTLDQVLGEVRNVPTLLLERRQEASRWLRKRAFNASVQGQDSLWNLHLQALESAGGLIERASTVPGLDKVGPGARELLGTLEKLTTTPPLADYDELNVRKVMSDLRDLDHLGLLRVQRYEAQHKNRKTIHDAIEREMDRRARLAAA